MSIGIAKPMPWAPPAAAVLMPMTLPLGSNSGPPLLPGLIAVSVWMRLREDLAGLDRDAATERGDDPAGDRVRELAERAADGDGLLADLDRRRVTDRSGREPGRLDLDDGQVRQRVDAVDGRVERAAVLEVDRQLLGVTGDDVVVGQDQPVGVEDDAGAGRRSLLGLTRLRIGRRDPVGHDGHDRRADGLDDVDDGAVAGGHGAGARDVADRGAGRGRMATRRGVDREIGPAGGEESRREDGAQDEARADGTSLAGRDRRGRRFDRGRHVRRRGGGRFGRSGRAGRSQRGDLVVHRFLLAGQRRHVRAPHAGRLVRSSGRFLRVW